VLLLAWAFTWVHDAVIPGSIPDADFFAPLC
jgi:hypothetical protein